MIGMLQIITYLLCVYLVFKGIEIFQIANVKSKENDGRGLYLGTAMIVISVIVALVFYTLINTQAETVGSSGTPRFP
jgi:uncharacterized membrane protein